MSAAEMREAAALPPLRCQGCCDVIPEGSSFQERVDDGCPFCPRCAEETAKDYEMRAGAWPGSLPAPAPESPGVLGAEALREIATRAEHGPDECREDVYALLRSHAALSQRVAEAAALRADLAAVTRQARDARCDAIIDDMDVKAANRERDAARAEAERMRAQMAEARAALAYQERIAVLESVPDDGRASSTGLRGQATGRRATIAAALAALALVPAESPEPTPEEMAADWRRLHSCSVPTFEDGVRAARARRSTSPVEQAAEPPSAPVPEAHRVKSWQVRGGG